MKKILFLLIIFSALFLVIGGASADTRIGCPSEGLVPCGTEGCPCTLCDLFVMFSRIINYVLFEIVPVVAVLMIAIGGFMFMLAYAGKGGPDTLSKARALLKSVAIGLILIYAAWIIINSFFMVIGVNEWTGLREGWWKIDCESSVPSSGSSPNYNTPSSKKSSPTPQQTTPSREKPKIGEVISVKDRVDVALIGSDEITVNTQVKNTSGESKKYRAILWDGILLQGEEGKLVQKGGWVTIKPGKTKTIKVSTDWKKSSIDDFTKDHYTITVSEEGGETIGRIARLIPSH